MNLRTFRRAMSVFLLVSLSSGLIASEWHVAPPPGGDDSNPGTNELPFATVQRGIDAASDGDTVIVAQGTYLENIHFDGKNIIVTSTDALDPSVVANTIIDGDKAGSVVTFSGTETEACVLSGFTIQNGDALEGGGIYGGTDPVLTHATIENNMITGNSAGEYGGVLAYCNGTIQNNTITGNSAGYGGGLVFCHGVVQNNTITGNSAERGGGGLASCNGTIQNNTITGNSANWYGGGLSDCNGTIQNNAITENSSQRDGGGLRGCSGTIQNNTITGNSAVHYGGGLGSCNGAIRNSIIWANTAPTGPQLHESSVPTYSCIEGWTGDPERRNISGDPRFAGPDTDDFRLLPSSPCIDAGSNDPDLPATDIAGMPRMMFGGKSLTVDMGAWEYYINTLSRELNGSAVLTWSSLAGKTYRVEHSSDMLSWQTAEENVPSVGDYTTAWTDTTAPFLSPSVRLRYYRTVEK